jgi:hypothetical protein
MPGEDLTYGAWRERTRLTPTAMDQIISRAIAVLEGLYVHRRLKMSRHHTDPIAELRILQQRLEGLAERTFHDEMLRIHKSLEDVHTAYRLPEPFISTILYLPFLMKTYIDDDNTRRFVVARSVDNQDCEGFGVGVEIVTWNDVDFAEAVHESTLLEEGNTASQDLGLGLQAMTVRWLGASFEPRSDTVTVDYRLPGDDVVRRCTFGWRAFVNQDGPRVVAVTEAVAHVFDGSSRRRNREQALNVGCRVVQTFRRKMYAPLDEVPADYPHLIQLAQELRKRFVHTVERQDLRQFTDEHGLTPPTRGAGSDIIPSLLPAYLEAGRYDGTDLLDRAAACVRPQAGPTEAQLEAISGKQFGYLRIRAFPLEDPEAGLFKYELRRLLNLMPNGGLILDVRDNPGGSTRLAEESLQFLTPNAIRPVPFRFAATPLTKELTKHNARFEKYADSVATALNEGREFSDGIPITEPPEANALGQHYFGPVVLLTSGMTYSAGDIFAAGFVDNGVGPVVGVDDTTGGGGANCWFYNQYTAALLDAPMLPDGVNLQVAARECTRIRPDDNRIEEAGVKPTIRHDLTLGDVLEPQPWALLLRAATELSTRVGYDMDVSRVENGDTRTLEVRVDGIDRLEVQINDTQQGVDIGADGVRLALPESGRVDLEIRGYAGSALAARYVRVFRE